MLDKCASSPWIRSVREALKPERPFSPSACPIYYGWVVAAMAGLMLLCSIPGQTAGFSVFTNTIVEASGLSRLGLSATYALGTAISALFLPRAGRFSDRIGARLASVMAAGALLAGVMLIVGMPALRGFGYDWLSAATLTLAFSLTRFGGAGWLMLIASTLIGRWFGPRRGLVGGMFSALTSVVFAASPALILPLVHGLGWQQALATIAIVVGALGVFFLVFVRDSPEACGMLLEGGVKSGSEDLPAAPPPMTGTERDKAIQTATFWLIGCGGAMYVIVMTGFSFHLIDLGRSFGLSEPQSTVLFVPVALISIFGGIGVSILAARVPIAVTLGFFFVSMGFGTAAAIFASMGHSLVWMIIGLGAAGAAFSPFGIVLLPRAFGRLHLGAIQGFYLSLIAMASAVSPITFAASRRFLGSYNPMLVLLAGLCVVALTVLMGLRHRVNARGREHPV